MKRITLVVASLFCLVVLVFVGFMNYKSAKEQQDILEKSIENQLLTVCFAARDIIDVERFLTYTDDAAVAADMDRYTQVRRELRDLVQKAGVSYIYVLREIDGEALFIFDTDTEDEEILIPYELEEVHKEAFAGKNAAGVMNVVDEYGSFNTAAIPISSRGQVVGIICADMEDRYVQESLQASRFNTRMLIIVLFLVMAAMLVVVNVLMRRLRGLQTKLHHMAHHDTVTGLPNRQYLLEYLANHTSGPDPKPFALLFIDLDNFKSVNDNAGHDAGDELLRNIAGYLQGSLKDAKSFRPTAGSLNVAARIGGDEFVQIVDGVSDETQAGHVAQELLDGFTNANFDRYIEKYKVGLSIGVALYPYHSDNFHVLIKYADIAMYHAKHGGKNSYRIYTDEMAPKDEK
ncbi:GGDEF domain-containing protein [Clostridia bacterium OttesenSCG-928-O13]|nr:GGDEF domain-containing protein [Clostridia bacterium OttesenSCG-928-O13]